MTVGPAPQRGRRLRARVPGHRRPARRRDAGADPLGSRRSPGAWPTSSGWTARPTGSIRAARSGGRSTSTRRWAWCRSSVPSSSSTSAIPTRPCRTATAATSTTTATCTPSAASPTRAGVLREMLHACAELGLGAYAANHEFGRAQYEINLRHSDALDAADRAFRFKDAGQGDVGGAGPAGDVHRQALERRRGLRLPPAPVAGRRRGNEPAGRPQRAEGLLAARTSSSPACSSTRRR